MSLPEYVSYSSRKCYETCPGQYEFRYILKSPDLSDSTGSLFGLIIGKVFEWFYVRKLWMQPNPIVACENVVDEAAIWAYADKKLFFDRDAPLYLNLVAQVKMRIPSSIAIIRQHKLLASVSLAEVNLNVVHGDEKSGRSIKLGGRADFIHFHSNSDFWIVDGKASRHREQYTDPEQLIWYALQYYLKFHEAPSRLGFLYWSFPEDPIQWIAYDEDAMRRSLKRTYDVAGKIQLRQFAPSVSSACNLCGYIDSCPDGREYVRDMKLKSTVTQDNSVFGLEEV